MNEIPLDKNSVAKNRKQFYSNENCYFSTSKPIKIKEPKLNLLCLFFYQLRPKIDKRVLTTHFCRFSYIDLLFVSNRKLTATLRTLNFYFVLALCCSAAFAFNKNCPKKKYQSLVKYEYCFPMSAESILPPKDNDTFF